MNNSSDSDNNDDINKIKPDAPKKRGRPRKNMYFDKPLKNYERKEVTPNEKDIILHLPVSLKKKTTTDTVDTVKSVSDSEENSTSESESDSNSDSDYKYTLDSDGEDKKYSKKYQKLLEEIKQKDILIRQLNQKLESVNSEKSGLDIFDSDVQKDLTKHIIDLKLIDNITNKPLEIEKTHICCWWCTYEFDNYPFFIPEKYYNGKYYVFGNFCSFNCTASYNLSLEDYKVMERYALLKKLYEKFIPVNKMKLSPKKEVLTKFGGIVEIDEYRACFTKCEKDYRLNLPPLCFINHIIEEINIEKNIDTDNIKSNIHSIKKKLPMVKNNLFNTMGIKKN